MARLQIWPWMLCLAAVVSAAAVASTPPQSPPPRIVAIGDLHGDHAAWRAIARAARLTDAKGHWAGGHATLVQLGDIVDRAPDSLKIIRDLMRLEREAAAKGGHVVVLIGNHEAMMMTGDLRYVHPGEYAAFADRRSSEHRAAFYRANRAAIETAYRVGAPLLHSEEIRLRWIKATPLGMIEYRQAWLPGGELGRWTLGHRAVVRVGDSLFVHGGISAAYATIPIDEINRRIVAALTAGDETPQAIINDEMGPLWYRGLVTRSPEAEATKPATAPAVTVPRPTIEQEIATVLGAYQVKRIVVGHTPTLDGIVQGYQGKLWRIDSAISSAYGGTPSYLEITGDRVIAVKVPRPSATGRGTSQ